MIQSGVFGSGAVTFSGSSTFGLGLVRGSERTAVAVAPRQRVGRFSIGSGPRDGASARSQAWSSVQARFRPGVRPRGSPTASHAGSGRLGQSGPIAGQFPDCVARLGGTGAEARVGMDG